MVVKSESKASSVTVDLKLMVNGRPHALVVDPRVTLLDLLRENLALTGSKKGCDHGQCGACTVLVNGETIKSCMMLAIQADGASIATVEGLAEDGSLDPLQQSFSDHHALQCGYCTPGMLMSAKALLAANPRPSEEEIRKALQGNICRCTGYVNIVEAVKAVAT